MRSSGRAGCQCWRTLAHKLLPWDGVVATQKKFELELPKPFNPASIAQTRLCHQPIRDPALLPALAVLPHPHTSPCTMGTLHPTPTPDPTLPQAFDALSKKLKEINALSGVSGLLGWDEM